MTLVPTSNLDASDLDTSGAPDFLVSGTIPGKPKPGQMALPLVATPIYIMYNIPGLAPPLNLTTDLLRLIFRGYVTAWNDNAILALNPALRALNVTAPILRILRADYSGATGGIVHSLLDHLGLYGGDDARMLNAFFTNPTDGWLSVSAPGAPPARFISTRERADAELMCTQWAIAFTEGGDISAVLPSATVDGYDITNVTIFNGGEAVARSRVDAGLFTLDGIPPVTNATRYGYPLQMFVAMLATARITPAMPQAACCARVYWTAAFVALTVQSPETQTDVSVPLSPVVASGVMQALRNRVTCGGESFDQMRARYDMTLDEVKQRAAAQRAAQMAVLVGGAASAGAVVLLAVVVAMLWLMSRNRMAVARDLEEQAARAPRGEVAVLFTDIESSSQLWRAEPRAMRKALGAHFAILRAQVVANGGYEVKTEGDAMFAVFPTVVAAVRAACRAQEGFLVEAWPPEILAHSAAIELVVGGDVLFKGPRVRMGIGVGLPELEMDPTTHRLDYFGDCINHTARVADLAHGGQIILSDEAHAAVESNLVRCGLPSIRRLPPATLAGFVGEHDVFEIASPSLCARLGRWTTHRNKASPALIQVRRSSKGSRRSTVTATAGEGSSVHAHSFVKSTTVAKASSELMHVENL